MYSEENTAEMYTTTDICKQLGVGVSAEFIEKELRVLPVVRTKVGVYWDKRHLKRICYALSQHCHKVSLLSTKY
jgi:hypothetical protein